MKHTGEDHSLSYLLSRSSYEPLILATDNEKTILLEDDMTKRIKESKQVIIFNVGGEEFHILLKNFAVLPTTRLSRLVRLRKKKEILKLCDGFVYLGPPHKPEYIFNRNPYYFNAVLDVYRRGELHAPKNACSLTFHADLKFWGIDYYLCSVWVFWPSEAQFVMNILWEDYWVDGISEALTLTQTPRSACGSLGSLEVSVRVMVTDGLLREAWSCAPPILETNDNVEIRKFDQNDHYT